MVELEQIGSEINTNDSEEPRPRAANSSILARWILHNSPSFPVNAWMTNDNDNGLANPPRLWQYFLVLFLNKPEKCSREVWVLTVMTIADG
jgi:hypothetical protein